MDIFSIITLLGGLAFFLYGMNIMSSGLEKLAGSKLEGILRAMTSNRFKSLFLGAVITAVIQSSSAMTVMLVGLVNSGIMTLSQTIGVIMGANIGTTATAWILSLTGIESSNVFVNLLKPSSFSPVLALIGILLIMASKKDKHRNIGSILIGFAILMYGMEAMSDAVEPLAKSEEFAQILILFSNPIIGVIVGAVFTAIIQSSSASVGILQAFALTGTLSFGAAVPIIMGQNIGTCITSVISSLGANKNAKRVSIIHIYFNSIGTVIFLLVFYSLDAIFNFAFIDSNIKVHEIALVHSIFNISTTFLLIPFTKLLEKLAYLTLPDKKNVEEEVVFLDERLLLAPAFAIAECTNQTLKMAKLARDTMIDAISLYDKYDEKIADSVVKNEGIIDTYEDKLGTFLVKMSSKELSQVDSNKISQLLHTIGDIERISDHALNLQKSAQEMHEKNLSFSKEANAELATIASAIKSILNITYESFEKGNFELANQVEPLEQVIDNLKEEIRMRHIDRLKNGLCTIELGFILSDILSNYGRVSDHCSNIAVCMIQIKDDALDTHVYLNEVKNSDANFSKKFNEYKTEYKLPSNN